MKIIIEHEGLKAVLEDETIIDITDALDLIEVALVQVGFAPERIQAGIRFKSQERPHRKGEQDKRVKE
ncbi:MAG: hypothetical protein A2787_01910 [Omnitrophica WOR_2 bacterium RIFCSPHIGHO2_01_FULL_48_9]|nr:MAG: hypothetical protein A3D10_06745 [Omnitrophica WOR_2 bacterium RIFCSPHIGHO2_02_FULL_48_11]OGX34475.1 MAG: hypothetical protein A2787_01910 [Omnitrophica WOR_2 bacterium RIFCSPHIGHO2_01_FULL_48_9]